MPGNIRNDIPIPLRVTAEDAQFAVRAVIVHAPEAWPAAGLTEQQIDELAAGGDPSALAARPVQAAAARRAVE